jgi:hypothetical protein
LNWFDVSNVLVPIAGEWSESYSPAVNAQLTSNFIPRLEKRDGKTMLSLIPTPGLKFWKNTGVGACRGDGIEFKGECYFVFGNKLVKLNSSLVMTEVGTLLTNTGRVSMAASHYQLMVVDGSYGYVYDSVTTTFYQDIKTTVATAADFPANPTHVTMMNFYFIVEAADSDAFYVSSLSDGSALGGREWNALDVKYAEFAGDEIMAHGELNSRLWMFGEWTTELFYNSGSTDFPFDKVAGGTLQWGMAARYSLAQGDSSWVWLGRQKKGGVAFVRASGSGLEIISDRNVEWALEQMDRVDDAYATIYMQAGETYYMCTFPSEQKTVCYAFSSKMWHIREGYGVGQHRLGGHCYFAGRHLVGDFQSGNLYEFDLTTYEDQLGSSSADYKPIVRRRRMQTIHKKGANQRIFHYGFEVELETGLGLLSGQGSDPQVMLRWSDDQGKTWSNEHWRSAGARGQFKKRVRWNVLGAAYNRIYEITVSDPINWTLINAYLNAEPGVH